MKYQQGDVLLKLVEKINNNTICVSSSEGRLGTQNNYNEQADRVVLAEGEATGHLHQIPYNKQEPGCTILGYQEKMRWQGQEHLIDYLEVYGESATMYHEEHNPLTIPKGTYKVSIVREYDPMSQIARSVYD